MVGIAYVLHIIAVRYPDGRVYEQNSLKNSKTLIGLHAWREELRAGW
jgi:hypothetical protein